MRQILFYTTVILLISNYAFAQNSIVKGFVFDKDTKEPLSFANIFLVGTKYGVIADIEGYYTISKIPEGKYTLMVSVLGYDSATFDIDLNKTKVITKTFYIGKADIQLNTINVNAKKQESINDIRTSVMTVTPMALKLIPSIGGEPEIAQYLQSMPGVVFTGDQGGQLYIRGGSPIQNKVLMDGVPIYNPFHSIGLFSVFETDIIRSIDVYTAGFNAEYGGRISSVMDITTRDGSNSHLGGKVSANTFCSKILLEGPLNKKKNDNTPTFILSYKNSYLDKTSDIFYNYIDTASLPYAFNDFYGKLTLSSEEGNKLNFFGFNYNDKVNYPDIASMKWRIKGLGANFIMLPSSSNTKMEGFFAYSDYKVDFLEIKSNIPKESFVGGFTAGMNLAKYTGAHEIKYGIELNGFKTNVKFKNTVGREIEQSDNSTEFGCFVRDKIKVRQFIIEPSIRVQYYASLADISPEPRLAIKYMMLENFRLKAAGGLYSQNLTSTSTDREIINLFTGFISSVENLPASYKDDEISSRLQKAWHAVLGFEWDIFKNFNLNCESYYKNFILLTNLNPYKQFDDLPENYLIPDIQKKNFIYESGEAYGIDFSFTYSLKKVNFNGSYSYSFIFKDDGIINYYAHYDRRHNANISANYKFGKKETWLFSARWNLGSGFPFTQITGYYPKIVFDEGISTDYISKNHELGTIYGETNSSRLPDYHRLDVSLSKSFIFSKYSTLEINLGVTNVYNRANIFYYDKIQNKRINQLPTMPSLGISLTF